MRVIKIIVLVFILGSFGQLIAQDFDFNNQCKSAYQAILDLKLEKAQVLLEKEKKANPQNHIPILLENYVDFFTVFINENKSEFERLEVRKDNRLKQLEKVSSNSPYKLYSQAVINLQWAFARVKFKEYYSAFWEVKKAYKLLEKNKQQYPNFIANDKDMGVLHTLVGTIPDSYKWGAKMLGLDGSIQKGLKELERVINADDSKFTEFDCRSEAEVFYALLQLHLNKSSKKAWTIIQKSQQKNPQSLLATFSAASISMHIGKNDAANKILINRPQSKEYFPFVYLEFLEGITKLRKLDLSAKTNFENYIENSKSQHYIKEAYQKLAWIALLNNSTSVYKEHLQNCINVGLAQMESDKEALREAENDLIPDKKLIKARLLFDGGYYSKALAVIKTLEIEEVSSESIKISEYWYRLGRIYQKMNQNDKAIDAFERIAEADYETKYYYPAASNLQLGNLYSLKKNKNEAEFYFEETKKFIGHPYKNSFSQQAKAGLERL